MAVTINGTTGIVTPDIGVDGSTLVVDSVNNRIGIGISSPGTPLDVAGIIQSDTGLQVAGHPVVGYATITGGYAARLGSTGSTTLNKTQIYARGAHVATFDGATGNVGIGTDSPSSTLQVGLDPNSGNGAGVAAGSNGALKMARTNDADQLIEGYKVGDSSPNFVVRADGKVGINQTSPNAPLSFASATGQKIEFYNSGSNNEFGIGVQSSELRISTGTSSFIAFRTGGYNGSERLRITAEGSLNQNATSGLSYFKGSTEYIFGSNTSSPPSGGAEALVQIHQNKTRNTLNISGYQNNAGGPILAMISSRSATVGTLGSVTQNNDELGAIRFGADGGSSISVVYGAIIKSVATATATSSGVASDLRFFTSPNSTGTGSQERLRITSSGQVSISSDGTADGLLTIKGNSDALGTPSIRLLDGGDTREVSISNTAGDFVASTHGTDNNAHGQIKIFESGIIQLNTGGASGTFAERLRITSGGIVKINNPSMVGGTNAANALLQIKATGQYDGLVFGNTYSQGAIGTNSQGALIYTGNAAPANLGGGLKHTHIWYSGTSGGGGPSEKMSLATDGTLYLGPYDAPGSYTAAANNIPYQIKVAPYGWQHHSELAAISMGNHSGATGNDDGEIVFKTTKDAHSSTTGLVERLRINSNGDATFYGNPSIDATDLYYTNSYSTNGWSTSLWYTVVPHSLTSNSTYLVALVWDWGGSHGSPYYVATQQLYSTVNGTNGTGSENELTPMVSTHTGGTGARINCRVLAQNSGSPAMQVNMNYTMGSSSYLKVKVWKMTFLNRS